MSTLSENIKSDARKYHERKLNLKYPEDVPACVTLQLTDLIHLQTSNPEKKHMRLESWL
jgi:hypothetical protein